MAVDFDSHDSYYYQTKVPTINGVVVGFIITIVLVIFVRLWSRCYVVRAMGLDDWFILGAATFFFLFCGTVLVAARHGMGRHREVLDHDDWEFYSIMVWVSAIMYNTCLALVKASVLALYLRITPSNGFRVASLFMLFIIASQCAANVLVVIFQCTPVNYLWDRSITGTCIQINEFYIANAALNIATDIMTYLLPIPTFLNLQLPQQQKIGLIVILSLGAFACIASIVRITYVVPMLISPDITWVIAEAEYWSVIEMAVGITAASVPSFKVLAKRYWPRILGSSHGDSKTSRKIHLHFGHGRKSREFKMHMLSGRSGIGHETTIAGPERFNYDIEDSRHNSQDQIIAPEGKIIRTTQVAVAVEGNEFEDA